MIILQLQTRRTLRSLKDFIGEDIGVELVISHRMAVQWLKDSVRRENISIEMVDRSTVLNKTGVS